MADAAPDIEVEGPDGQVFAFPQGTDQGVMATALKRHYAGWKPSPTAQDAPQPDTARPQVPSYDAMGMPTGGSEDAPAPTGMSYGDQMQNVGGAALDSAVRVSRGVPFADRGAAALRSQFTGNSYADELAGLRGAADRDKAAHPWAATTGDLVGGSLVPFGMLGNVVKGATLGGKVIAGGLTGAGYGAASGLSGTADLTNYGDAASNTGKGALAGLVIGGGVPVVGAGLGAGYRAAAPFFAKPVDGASRTTTGLLANALSEHSSDALDRLGPQAILADASPSLTGYAQGIAAKPGPSADALAAVLLERQQGQAGRLATDLDANLGPAISRGEINAGMDARQAATNPMYETALGSAPSVEITPASQALENAMLTAKGRNVGRLNAVQEDLQAPYRVHGRVVPESDPRALQQARFAMDEEIARTQGQAGSAASTATRDLSTVRGALNDAMERQLPGYADANLAWGTAQRGRDAYEAGRTALNGGKTAIWPEELASDFAARPLEGQALYRAGARADIANQVGTNRNDLAALGRTLGDDMDFNRAKMGTLFGEEPTQNVIDAVNREKVFTDTANRVTQGSRTAPMATASRAIDDATAPADFVFPKSATIPGLIAHAGEAAVRKTAGAIAGQTNDNVRQEMARMLMASGEQRQTLQGQLLAAQLRAHDRGQGISAVVGNPALARALIAYERDGDRRAVR